MLALSAIVTVAGVVEAQERHWDHGVIVTQSTIRVDGDQPTRMVVTHLGGDLDGYGQIWSHTPTLALGERASIDVERDGAGWQLRAKRTDHDPWLYARSTNHQSGQCLDYPEVPIYWRQVAIDLTFAAAFSADLSGPRAHAAFTAAMATWNAQACSYLKLGDAGTAASVTIGFDRDIDNTNAILWVESGWTRGPNVIAATLNTFECASGRVVDSDMIWNGVDWTFTDDPVAQPAAMDLQNTATHELGHLVGFDHAPDPESTMAASADPGETKKRDLTADDIAGLCAVYPVGQEPEDEGGCCSGGGSGGGRGAAGLAALTAIIARRRRQSPKR